MSPSSEGAAVPRKGPAIAIAIACFVAGLGMQAAAAVKPPPLPPGSSMVRVQGGLNPDEVKRHKRAHHNKTHHRKDLSRDDSRPDNGKDKDKDRGNGKGNDKNGRKQ